MFIDTIDEKYPHRLLRHIELDQSGFVAIFDVSKKHHLEVSIHAYKDHNEEKRLIIYETIQETGGGHLHHSQGENFVIDGDESSILPLLKSYLQMVVGNRGEHLYENSFVGDIVDQFVR